MQIPLRRHADSANSGMTFPEWTARLSDTNGTSFRFNLHGFQYVFFPVALSCGGMETMQDFNTIIGVIQMRQNECSFSVIQKRYHIGSGTTQRILSRFEASGLTLEELRQMDPHIVEELIYPPKQVRRKDIPLPNFQYYYDRIHAKGSKVNIV